MGAGASVTLEKVESLRMAKTPGDDNEYLAYFVKNTDDKGNFTVIWADDPSETEDDTCCSVREYTVFDALHAKDRLAKRIEQSLWSDYLDKTVRSAFKDSRNDKNKDGVLQKEEAFELIKAVVIAYFVDAPKLAMGLCTPEGWTKAWGKFDVDASGSLDIEETVNVVKEVFEIGKEFLERKRDEQLGFIASTMRMCKLPDCEGHSIMGYLVKEKEGDEGNYKVICSDDPTRTIEECPEIRNFTIEDAGEFITFLKGKIKELDGMLDENLSAEESPFLKLFDKDQNGTLSSDEAFALAQSLSNDVFQESSELYKRVCSKSAWASHWRKYDVDHNQTLSSEEAKKMLKNLFQTGLMNYRELLVQQELFYMEREKELTTLLQSTREKPFSELTEDQSAAAVLLQFTEELWDAKARSPLSESKKWVDLTEEEQSAAKALGFFQKVWGEDTESTATEEPEEGKPDEAKPGAEK
eukprot:g1532.t1